MSIAMVSEHASPLAVLGGEDAGGQNVHVAALSLALARRRLDVVVHTRRDNRDVPRRVRLGPGVIVDHVDAGPPHPLPKDELLPWMGDFARDLLRSWTRRPPVILKGKERPVPLYAPLETADQPLAPPRSADQELAAPGTT